MAALPQGFTLDQPQHGAALPPGFTLDDEKDFSKHPPAIPDHRADAAAGMHEVFDPTMARYKPRSRSEQFSDIGSQISSAVEPLAKNLYQVSVPGVATSIAKEKYPAVASYIPDAMKRDATPLHALPTQLGVNALSMLAGAGEEMPPASRAAEAPPLRPTAPIEPPSPNTMGARIFEVAKRRASHIPGVQAAKDLHYIARGSGEVPAVTPPPKPAPIPETNGVRWGTGGEVPVDMRGKMIPPEPNTFGPQRTLPGMHSPEEFPQPVPPTPAAPIPSRSGLLLKGEVAPPPVTSPKAVGDLLNKAVGAEPLKPNVPLKNQLRGVNAQPPDVLPAGHEPVDSSALKSFKYDPQTKEFEAITKDGRGYVHGEISPEQAEAFSKADSKGKAWQDIRKNGTLVAKIINGKRISAVSTNARSATPLDEAPVPRVPAPNENLSKLGKQSLEMLKKRRQVK